jgi:outer membrane receptor protein involved in Fe transport
MKTKFKGVLTLLLAFVVQITFAQEKNISGTVSDSSGYLPGVSVLIKGTGTGTETDFDGKYTIKTNIGDVLVFRYLGFKSTEKTVGAASVINVSLQVDANVLDEIVITGQGSGILKRKLSTTVDVLTSDEIDKLPSTQIDALLQSTTPSAQIRLSSGQPGTAAIIRTRGAISAASSATPVIIVDGIRVDNLNSNAALGIGTGGANTSALADIPTESIERIEYIKGGAATTLYGADAANGVIQIITKKGKNGKTTAFIESRIGVIEATDDYLKYKRTGETIFETGLAQGFRFGLNGGSEKVTYNVGGSLYKDDSFNDLNEQIKRSFTFGLRADVSDKLKYQGSFSYTGFDSNLDYNANTSFSRFSQFEGGGRGDLDILSEEDFIVERDRAREIGSLVDISSVVNRVTASNNFKYSFNDAFQANFTFGIDQRYSKQQNHTTNALLVALDSESPGTTDQATINRALRNTFTLTSDFNITHRASVKDFSFVSILGGNFFRTTDRQNTLSGSGGVDGTTSVSLFPTKTAADFALENANYGLYLLENIGIFDVVFLEFGGRLDYNTSAGDNTDALFLPKIGMTYNISDHDFYKETELSNIVSKIKVRTNYGEATNFAQPFSEDRTFGLESFFGAPAFRFDQPGNKNLISETVKTTEFGLDLGFLNNRLSLSGTYYQAITEDALLTPIQPPSSGLLSQINNIGEIENSGFELALNATIIQTEKHNLKFNFSYNTNSNILKSSGGAPAFNVGGFGVIGSWIEEGQSLGYLRGTSSTPNGDGTYTKTPNAALGDTFAPRFGSFGLNYTWDKLNFYVTGDYQFGGNIVDLSFLLRHLRGVDDTGIPDDLVGTTTPFDYVNYFVFDNDYLKIRNIGVSYSFGNILKVLENVRVGLTVTNPFNFTAGNFDPEITGSGIAAQGGFNSGGFAYGTESAPRVFMSSIKFQF